MNSGRNYSSLIRNGILIGLTVWAAFYAGNAIADENIMPIGMLFAVSLGGILWFLTGNNYWVYVLASSFMAGGFPILGGTSLFVLLTGIGVAKYVIERIVLTKMPLKIGPQPDCFFICCFMGVMTYHAVHDRLGLKILGSDIWGGRFYVLIYAGLAGYFIINSTKSDDRAWAKLPMLIIGVYLFDGMIGIVTALIPSLVEVIGHIYNGVSLTNYVDEANGFTGDASGRVGAVGNFGFGILLLIFSRYRIANLWRPDYVVAFFGTLLGLAGVLMGGYRSTVISAFLLFIAIGLRDLKGRVALLAVAAVGLLLFLPVVNNVMPLPLPVQRSLAFIPSMASTEMGRDAEGSNEFRYTVWTTWYQQYFPRYWAFGRGFGFDPKYAEFDPTHATMHNSNWDIDFIETGSLHNGLISSVDCMGVVGAFFFIAWNIVVFLRVCRYLFREDRADGNPALRYISLYLFVSILSYWMGALNVGAYLFNQFILVAVFNMLLSKQRNQIALRGRSGNREDVKGRGEESSALPLSGDTVVA